MGKYFTGNSLCGVVTRQARTSLYPRGKCILPGYMFAVCLLSLSINAEIGGEDIVNYCHLVSENLCQKSVRDVILSLSL